MSTFDAGAIEAELTLDRSPFTRELKLAQQQAQKFAKTPVKIPLSADRTQLTRELKNAREQIRRLTKQQFNIKIGADTKGAQTALMGLKATANSLDGDRLEINADADTLPANLKLGILQKQANALDGDRLEIKADADTAAATAKLGALQGMMLTDRGGASLLMGALVAIAPAAVPVLAATTAAVAGLGGALAAAGGGALVLGAGIVGNFMRVKEMTDLVTKAQKKVRDAANADDRKKALQELADAKKKVAGLGGPMGTAANSLLRLQGAWNGFLKSVQGPAFNLISRGLNMVSGVLPKLTPLFNTFANVAEVALNQIGRWANGPGLRSLLNFFQKQGPPAMRSMIRVAGNLGSVVVSLLKAFAPFGNQVLRMLVRLTAGWAQWARGFGKSDQFKSFLSYAKQNLPTVAEFIGNLVGAAGNLVRALAPMGSMVLRGLNSLLHFIATVNPRVLEGIVVGIATLVGGFKLLTGAMAVFNAVSKANTVVLIITGVIALGAALVYAYKRSATFRAIVQGALHAVMGAAKAVVGWFTGSFMPFFAGLGKWFAGPFASFFTGAWDTVKGAFSTAKNFIVGGWNAIKGAFSTAGSFIASGWNAIKGAFATAGRFIGGVWNGIVAGAKVFWGGVMTVFNGLRSAWNTVSSAFASVYHAYWSPIFQLFGAIVKRVFGTAFKLYMGLLKAEWMVVSTVIRTVWNAGIKPVFNGFGQIIRWLVNSVAKPLWNGMKAAWSGLGSLLHAVWSNVIHPAINGVGGAIRWLVNSVAKPLWRGMGNAWSAVASTLRAVWNNVIHGVMTAVGGSIKFLVNSVAKPLWNGMKSAWSDLGGALKWTYNNVIKPIITFFENRIKDLRGAFRHTVDGIRSIWNELKNIAKMPVKFVLNTVLNNGLIAGFNKLAGVFGTDQMDTIPMPFSRGSWVPGNSPTSTADNIPAMLTAKEFVVRQPAAIKADRRHPGFLERLNETGDPLAALGTYGIGGWIGNAMNTVKGAVGGAVNWSKDLASSINPVGIIKHTVNGLLNKVGGSAFADMVKGGGSWLLRKAWSWIEGKVGLGGAAASGPHISGGYRWLEKLVGSHVPGAIVTSDIRPGATTIYGTPSMHGLGRAVDWGGNMRGVWNFLYPLRGRLHELLGPWGMFRDGHVYRDPTLQAMHENHVHASTFAKGGFVSPVSSPLAGMLRSIPTFDNGGVIQPGYNTIYNDLSRPETLVNKDLYDERDDKIVKALEAVLAELRKPQRVALTPDGREAFEAVIERTAKSVNGQVAQKVYNGRKG